jgi:hypothetical protein
MSKDLRIFWLRWVWANLAGELAGLGTAFIVSALVSSRIGESGVAAATLAMAALAVLLGTFEGFLVGIGQHWALEHPLPQLPWRAWVAATAFGAFLAWILGMLPSTLISLSAEPSQGPAPEMSDALQLVLAVPLGIVAGAILATPQWLVLRRYVTRAWRWIPANAAAWALGMPVVFIGAGQSLPGASGLGLALGVLLTLAAAGAIVGAVHGWALARMLAPDSH